MKPIPAPADAVVLRTDFSDEAVWKSICKEIREPVDGAEAYVDFVDDIEYANLSGEILIAALPHDFPHSFLIVADGVAISHPEHQLLVVNLSTEDEDCVRNEFRAIPSTIAAIENNLTTANMGFEDFADSLDEMGVFRGFSKHVNSVAELCKSF